MTDPEFDTDGAAILDALHAAIVRYVVLPTPEAADAVVLWIAATHAQPAWAHAARLVIRAPEKRCGKSRLLDVVEATSFQPIMTVNASTAAVYRAIGANGAPPTLLIDEADTIFGARAGDANEDLRGLLNAGHQRGRPTIRWDATNRCLERIETFAMAALAGIGRMPDTIEDRAVVVRMRRRTAGEKVFPYRVRRDGPPLRDLAAQLFGWLHEHLAELERAAPAMPVEDRAADTWESLVAVADLAGGDWPARARAAIVALTSETDDDPASSDRIRLLADCRTAFEDADALPTVVLIDRLKADPEAPWADYAGTGLTPMRLAGLLREYDIRSTTIRFPSPIGQAKGYARGDFHDAWARYCPTPEGEEPYQPSHPSQTSSDPVRLEDRYGSSRTTKQAVPALTSRATTGTAGTASPHLRVVDGGR